LRWAGRLFILIDANKREYETRLRAAASMMGTMGQQTPGVEEIEPLILRAARNSGELWQVLDVREPWEIEIASIRDTINIPMGSVVNRLQELDPSRATAGLCHSGVRSLRVATFLSANGFVRVANVCGGIECWALTADPSVARY
jgi:rhodanese-related sulfurtransferase